MTANNGKTSGLYRLRDTTGDDQFDEVVLLKSFCGTGEHGPHALRLSPDGKSIFILCGNFTDPPFDAGKERTDSNDSSAIPTNWGEDLLLPRQWDARGHGVGRYAPGGWIAKTDPDGKSWHIYSIGYRNPYDMAFNADGELFTYDADMERDLGMPWYRPTRVVHATAGGDFGWRSGTGKWPPYYVDSLPPMLDIGPGSPVGVTFGYGAHFPAKYQRTLFICDWTYGTIYALHLEPDGASYAAVKEEFLSRTPLPLTDIVVGSDGALYFTIGGRGLPSELFRVTYVGRLSGKNVAGVATAGPESTAPVDARDERGAALRQLRREIEGYQHRVDDPRAAADFLWPYLEHEDRFIRYAARVALEFQPVESWQERLLSAGDGTGHSTVDPRTLITATLALARQGDKSLQPRLLNVLKTLRWHELSDPLKLDLLRAYQLVFIRMGMPDSEERGRLAEKFERLYATKDDFQNRELCQLLVYLRAPSVLSQTIPILAGPSKTAERNDGGNGDNKELDKLISRGTARFSEPYSEMLKRPPDARRLYYFFVLRNVKDGWTLDDRKIYYGFLREAETWSGGASYQDFLKNIERDAFENASEKERLAIEALAIRPSNVPPELPKPKGPGRDRTADDVLQLVKDRMRGRDFRNGKTAFAAARCVICHRFEGEGGATGPDLTQLAGRFSARDLIEAIIEPSKVVSDQYRQSIYLVNGVQKKGRVVAETDNELTLLVDPEDSSKTEVIAKRDLEETPKFDPMSAMPAELLNPLNDDELLDLLAYLLSRGNPKDPMFRR